VNRVWPTAAALIAAVLLQAALAPSLRIFGIVPNIVFLVVVTLALVEGPIAGCTAGFVGGLLFDLLGSGVVGPSALVLTLVGYVAGLMQANMFAEGWLLPVTVVAVASLAAEVTYGIVLAVVGAGQPFWSSLVRVMLPGALYNTVLAVMGYPVLARLLRRDTAMKSFRRLA
jgi:rod shape-determining protein MreD